MLAAIVDVAHVGLPVMALLIGLESTGIPLPGETALIAAAILASRGHFDIVLVIVLAATAAILGDNLGYLIGRRGGRRVLRHPRLARFGDRIIERGQPFFERHGGKTVFLGRWITGLRIGAAWLAGINHMRWPSFVFWNAAGGIAWATSIGLLAYFLGESAEKAIKTAGIVGAGGVVLGGVAALAWLHLRRRRREPAGPAGSQGLDEELDAANWPSRSPRASAGRRRP